MPSTVSDPEPAQTPVVPATQRRGTLLIVDDEDGPRFSIQVIFKEDYDVLLASDGPSAIQIAQKQRIDVAILDIRMAGMSGIEVLERLKYVDPGIEVIMMTAFETADTMRQALRLRACDYINKPFDLGTIRTAVANAMQRRTLEGEITNNAEQLRELMQELQNQKMQEQISQTRGEIYASIIHDINTPLTVISGFMQMLNGRIGNATTLTAEDTLYVKDRLKTITRQVTNCIEISRRYLSFLRKSNDDFPKVTVNQLLSDVEHLVRVHPSRHNHEFQMQLISDKMGPRMNGTDLIQVVLNLAVNAFQCTQQPHSVQITGEILNDSLELEQMRDSSTERLLNVENFLNEAPLLKLTIGDTGPGIPPETLPKIFEPYFTTKGPRQGTGLGLNIVQRLVKEAKGALHVQTTPGQGTRFTVYIRAATVVG